MFKPITVVAAALLFAASSGPLSSYVGRARLLVISAPSPSDALLRRQDHDLASFSAEMDDRDLVVIHLAGATAIDTRGEKLDATAVRRAVRLPLNRFGVALVGKDGGVKLRRIAPITVDTLFRTIDTMPMRQEEMGRRRADDP